MPVLPVTPTWLKADSLGKPVGVDAEKKIIHGYVVAQKGPFKSEGRGEFDDKSLSEIVRLYGDNPMGIKSRFAHPTLSDDGIGKFLGRSRDARLDGDKVRADLHLDPTSFHTPSGDLGGYVMALAQSDAGAFSSSLVLQINQEYRLNPDGTRQTNEKGDPLPPLWRPTRLHASDVVDTGDAVDDFLAANLSSDHLPDVLVRKGSELLNQAFPGQPREVVQARLQAWLDKYLQLRYGSAPGRTTNALKRKIKMYECAAS